MTIILPAAPAKLAGAIINGLGDSEIGSQSVYADPAISLASVPAWTGSTAYATSNVVKNGGYAYRCVTGGTSAASGGPSGTGSSIADNTVTWAFYNPLVQKQGTSFLKWVESFSLGRLNFDLSQGYGGLAFSIVKIIVTSGGSGYTAPTITLSGGATATVQSSGGVITGITLTNPGYSAGAAFTGTLSGGGTGCAFSIVQSPSGTFGINGFKTADMVALLPDCIASNVDIFVVQGGTNDCSAGVGYNAIVANLRSCYETLMAAGRKVIAIPILPRTGLTNAQMTVLTRVNNWMRAYSRKEAWANPLAMPNIVLADPSVYMSDGTNATNQPVGGSGGTAYAMTQDGLHQSPRGAMYMGYCLWQAAQQFIGPSYATPAHAGSKFDAYDPVLNVGGNILEGLPWAASTAYVVGQIVSNSSNVYRCVTAGTTASSGGPTGTGSSIADGTAAWTYVRPSGMSVFTSGTTGTSNTATGITFTGSLAGGYTLNRNAGSASGTVTETIESPWSSNQVGKRQALQFTLGTGTASETWDLRAMYSAYASMGIQASDLGGNLFFAECELELSSVANLQSIGLYGPYDPSTGYKNNDGGNGGTGTGWQMMASSGEMIAYPNGGKLYLRTQPSSLPLNLVNFCLNLIAIFDASGAAGSATATIKINYLAIRRAGVA